MDVVRFNNFELRAVHAVLPYVHERVVKPSYVPDNVRLLNVDGGGYCGYYVIGLLYYLQTLNAVGDRRELQQMIVDTNHMCGVDNLPSHWVESFDMAGYASAMKFNVGIVFSRQRMVLEPFCYISDDMPWIFVVCSGNNIHWQVLARAIPDSRLHSVQFNHNQALRMFQSLKAAYPNEQIDPPTFAHIQADAVNYDYIPLGSHKLGPPRNVHIDQHDGSARFLAAEPVFAPVVAPVVAPEPEIEHEIEKPQKKPPKKPPKRPAIRIVNAPKPAIPKVPKIPPKKVPKLPIPNYHPVQVNARRCQAKTQKKVQCTRKVYKTKYCWQHSPH